MALTLILALAASAFYLSATVVLKHWATLPLSVSVLGILVFLVLACAAEIAVLQRARFAEVVVLIISLEVAMALLLSRHYFGESYGVRDFFGIAFLVLGAGLLVWEPAATKGLGQGKQEASLDSAQG